MLKSGIILLDKPEGITSRIAVNRVKRITGSRTAGHTGTLDPMATGLLPVCFGRATRAAAFISEGEKTYRATLLTGISTDTDDITGQVISTSEIIPYEALLEVLPRFRGKITQIPPIYSAIRVGGERLYRLAREGKSVDIPERTVEISAIELEKTDREGEYRLTVTCSKGTYIRSLCRDIAAAAGGVGAMSSLRRLASGRFDIKDAYTLEKLEEMSRAGDFSFALGTDRAFSDLPEVHLPDAAMRYILNGADVPRALVPASSQGRCRLYVGGEFVALAEIAGRAHVIKSFFEVDR